MSPVRVMFNGCLDCESLIKNFTVKQVYNDDKIIQLTDNSLKHGLLETLKIVDNYVNCEMVRCKHNSGEGKCQLEYIYASLVDKNVLCASKEMRE